MTRSVGAVDHADVGSDILRRCAQPTLIVCVYVVLYAALDRISMVQMLPGTGFTLWDPSAAASVALLWSQGLWFAPVVLAAAILADGLNGSFMVGITRTLTIDVIITAGYVVLVGMLRPFVIATIGFQNIRDVASFLGIVGLGTLGLAGVVGVAMILPQALPLDHLLPALRHFWIGEFTGIVSLFPALITASLAWKRWRELSAHSRWMHSAVFILTLVVASWLVFGTAGEKKFQFFYPLLLPVIWVGARHGLPWGSLAILTEQVVLITIVTLQRHPPKDVADFQVFLLAVAATGLVVGTVVSERQRSDLRLRQQQAEIERMARAMTAGALGSAIVHEISQPLATAATYAHACRLLLRSESQNSVRLAETLAKIEAETLRAGEIMERLREFLSKGDLRLTPLDVVDVARRIATAIADESRSRGVEVRIDAHSATWIMADRIQVEQVLLNLVRNGIEAAAENGVRERLVRVRLQSSGNAVQVDVEDNGLGVPPELVEHLFEPFATGKPKGLGLGLLLSQQIVKCHGGDLWYDQTLKTGARFSFRLPKHSVVNNG